MKKISLILAVIAFFALTGIAGAVPTKVAPEVFPYAQADNNTFITPDGVGIVKITGGISMTHDTLISAYFFFKRYNIKKMVLYINSGGGDLFEGTAAAQFMLELEAKGWIIETRCYGLAASAASIIMAAGSKGHRYISPHSFLMIHELSVVKFLSVESLSDKEKETAVLRGIQDNVNDLIAKCTGQSAEKIKEAAKKETWLIAKRAIEMGFADKLIPDGLKKRQSLIEDEEESIR